MKEVILGKVIKNNHKMTEAAHVSGPCDIVDSNDFTPCTNYVPCIISSSEDISKNELVVFPNPVLVGEILTVDSEKHILSVQILDVQGKEVFQEAGSSVTVLHSLQAGIYFLRVNFEEGSRYKKLLIAEK